MSEMINIQMTKEQSLSLLDIGTLGAALLNDACLFECSDENKKQSDKMFEALLIIKKIIDPESDVIADKDKMFELNKKYYAKGCVNFYHNVILHNFCIHKILKDNAAKVFLKKFINEKY